MRNIIKKKSSCEVIYLSRYQFLFLQKATKSLRNIKDEKLKREFLRERMQISYNLNSVYEDCRDKQTARNSFGQVDRN